MRIGVLTSSFPHHSADLAGRFVFELAQALTELGHQIEVLAAEPLSREDPRLHLRPLPASRRLYGPDGPLEQLCANALGARVAAWAAVPAFVRTLFSATRVAAAGWDALISHWLLPAGLTAALAAPGRPHLAFAHSADVHLLARYPAVAQAALQPLVAGSSRLVCTSEALQAKLASRVYGRTRAWVEAAAIERMGIWPRQLGRRDSGTPETSPAPLRVLYLGRLVRVKGVDALLDACAGEPVVLAIAGCGPEEEALRRRAAALGLPVRFWGRVDSRAKWALLAQADVLVLPSRVLPDGRTESAPVVLLEAMAAGAAVVATAVGGNAELIRHGVDGLLVAADEGPARTLALRLALRQAANANLRARWTRSAAERAARYHWPAVAERVLAALTGIDER